MSNMSLSVNGQNRVPPGFRFHPTEEELLHYYLRKKVTNQKIDLDVIRDVDLNKREPWDIQEKCKIGSTPQTDWYFFSHKDKKYPTGTRTNRATAVGFWKATGRDKVIYSSCKRIGMRKTLVFYRGRAPHGQRSDWIMHEYRLDDQADNNSETNDSSSAGETTQEEGWVVCRVFKKKYLHKTQDGSCNSSTTNETQTQMLHSSSEEDLDQIFECIGRTCKSQNEINKDNMMFHRSMHTSVSDGVPELFMQFPQLESPTLPPIKASPSQTCYTPVISHAEIPITHQSSGDLNPVYQFDRGINNWAALDRLVASHLNCQADTSKQLAFFNDPNIAFYSVADREPSSANMRSPSNGPLNIPQDYNSNIDLWSFTLLEL